MVAFKTTGNDVFPSLAAALNDRMDVVECEILCSVAFPAVLACIMIPRVDIGPAKFHVSEMPADLYILQESEDTGHFYGKADASDFAVIFGQNLNFTLA